MSRQLVSITGFKELEQKLKKVASDRQKFTEIKKVLRKVAHGTVKVARREAPVAKKAHWVGGKRFKEKIDPTALQKSIGVIDGKRGAAKENPTVYAGPRAKGRWKGWYGHFVEYGHNVYNDDFKRKHSASENAKAHNATGVKSKTAADPFMQRAYDQTKGQVTAETQKSVEKVIQKVIDKYSR